ncbi:MAG: hypothetical protein HY075_05920, partial [Deltaproteobacteria bacterium]|nr:hypothetical protein [Deltaproteobacteria bacterium]
MQASRGVRFAPSPTGAFHVGNFRTAWISESLARSLGEPWIVRFEDIDAPRVVPGALERQTSELAQLGLVADGVLVQSQFRGRHWLVFERAVREGRVYPCFCSRKDVKSAVGAPPPADADPMRGAASAPHALPAVYTGRCRDLKTYPAARAAAVAWRFRSTPPDGSEDFIVARAAPVGAPAIVPPKETFAPAYNW